MLFDLLFGFVKLTVCLMVMSPCCFMFVISLPCRLFVELPDVACWFVYLWITCVFVLFGERASYLVDFGAVLFVYRVFACGIGVATICLAMILNWGACW